MSANYYQAEFRSDPNSLNYYLFSKFQNIHILMLTIEYMVLGFSKDYRNTLKILYFMR